MNREKAAKLIVGVFCIVLIYNLVTLYKFKYKLTEYTIEDIKEYAVEMENLISENSDLLTEVINTGELKYDDSTRFKYNQNEIHNSFVSILTKLRLIKSEAYIKKHMDLYISKSTELEILDLYISIEKDFDDTGTSILREDYIKDLEIILNAYEFYESTLDEMIEKINKKDKSWIDELNELYIFDIY